MENGKLLAIKELIEIWREEGDCNEGSLLTYNLIDIIYNIVKDTKEKYD